MGVAMWALLEVMRTITWPDHKQATQMVIMSREELANVWFADGGRADKLPDVNFDTEMVLAVFAGPSQGGTIRILNVHQIRASNEYAPGTVIVMYKAGGVPAKKLTYPAGVAVVKKVNGQVVFLDADSEEGQRLLKVDQKVDGMERNLRGTDRPDRFGTIESTKEEER